MGYLVALLLGVIITVIEISLGYNITSIEYWYVLFAMVLPFSAGIGLGKYIEKYK